DPFSPEMMARQRGLPMALKVGDVVKERPGDGWMAFVDDGIKPKFATVFAKLYLKVNEEDEAFPYIEQLARTNPRQAKELAEEFTACHSTAEVYRLDAIEKVFGSFDILKPLTLAELIQQMRGNLIGVWRQPAEQEKNKTKRREKDIRAEVLRGYEVARAVIDRGLVKYPDHWA